MFFWFPKTKFLIDADVDSFHVLWRELSIAEVVALPGEIV